MAVRSFRRARAGAIAASAIAAVVIVMFGSGAPAAQAATHEITMAQYAFGPAHLTVQVGEAITWTNTDTAPHDVTTTSAPVAIHSPTITTGQSWSYTFTVAGTYDYICSIHPDMHASVTVEPAGQPTRRPSSVANVAASVAGADGGVSRPGTGASPVASPAAIGRKPPPNVPVVTGSTTGQRPPGVAATNAQIASATTGSRLKPLLFVAGIVAAIATLCLLMLASAPKGDS